MKKKGIEPGLIRVFQYFTLVSILYFLANMLYRTLESREFLAFPQIQAYWNLVGSLLLFAYLSIPWLQRRLKEYYLPIALTLATGSLLLSNVVYFPIFLSFNRSLIAGGIQNIFPILFVPQVIISWQYNFRSVLLFIFAEVIVDLFLVWSAVGTLNLETLPVYTLPLMRAFTFGTVGHIVSQIVEAQHAQRRELIQANLRLLEHASTLEQLAVSRERNRLARELHDTLAHTLSGMTVNLEAIRLIVPQDMDEVHQMLDRSLQNTRNGLGDTRRALKALRAQNLEDMGLKIALEKLLDDAAQRSGFTLNAHFPNAVPKLDKSVEQGIFRIIQEVLENIVRHAEADQVKFDFTVDPTSMMIKISDDGQGFSLPSALEKDTHGVKGVYERAGLIHADLEIETEPGMGTETSIVLDYAND